MKAKNSVRVTCYIFVFSATYLNIVTFIIDTHLNEQKSGKYYGPQYRDAYAPDPPISGLSADRVSSKR